jgi:O-acetyl-ADP-ribose deacetylase (regulator of RNase III)
MPLEIVENDITKMRVDAIVNAANSALRMGGGVCGAIFRAAGPQELQRECEAIGGCETGQAVTTQGYRLPAKRIIHTVGPIWQGGQQGEAELLRNCYLNSLKLARECGCESIAFPLISTGIYGYPMAEAVDIAVGAIADFLAEEDMHVYLVVFDKEAFAPGKELLEPIQAYVDEHYVGERQLLESPMYMPVTERMAKPAGLDDIIQDLDESFTQTLFRLIDAKGKTDVEVYKRANIDRKLFSKIRSIRGYTPSKRTAVALAIALELNLQETKVLLERAGYTLSRSQLFDVIIQYFITQGKYDIFAINEALFCFDQPLLGG